MEDASAVNVCEDQVFQKIFLRNSKDLYRFLYYKYGPDNNPKDLVQDAFIKLWNNCKTVIPAKARSFLFTVANNQMLNELAKKKTVANFALTKPRGYTNESPQFLLEEKEYMKRLELALNDLSPEQRVAFMLNRVEGKKHQEIAEMLDISQKTVEKRIYTALAKLRERLGAFEKF